MKTTLEVSIRSVEGVSADLSSMGCYLSIDGRLYDVITPLSNPGPDATIKLPLAGELRLIIKNMSGNDQVFGSVSIPLEMLPRDPGRLWLPLFDYMDGDLLHALPLNPEPPRLLLSIGDPSPLSPVPELTERSSMYELDFEDQQKDTTDEGKGEKAKVAELQHQVEVLTWKLKVEEGLHREETEALKTHVRAKTEEWKRCSQLQVALVQDLTAQVASLQQLFSQEKKQGEVLNAACASLKEDFETFRSSASLREEQLSDEVLQRDTEITALRTQLASVSAHLRRAEIETNAAVASHRQAISQLDTSALAELQEALDLAVEQLADSEIQRKILQDELLKASIAPISTAEPEPDQLKSFLLAEIETLHGQIQALEGELAGSQDHEGRLGLEVQKRLQLETELGQVNAALVQTKDSALDLTQENDELKRELREFVAQVKAAQGRYEELHANLTLVKSERLKIANEFEDYRRNLPEGDILDCLLTHYFSERGLFGPLQRLNDGLYTFNGKKFSVMIRNAAVVARIGSGSLPLDGFLQLYMPLEGKHLDQNSRSLSVDHFKRHRRVNTVPNPSLANPRKMWEDEGEWSTSNTSQTDLMKPVPEMDLENSLEAANRPARTPSPRRKQSQAGLSKSSAKTPKTPNRSTGQRKSTDKSKRIPFR